MYMVEMLLGVGAGRPCPRREKVKGGKVGEVVWMVNGRKEYPPETSGGVDLFVLAGLGLNGERRPPGLYALSQPTSENSLCGIVRVDKYAPGEAGVIR